MASTFSTADKIRSNTYIGIISIEVGGKPVTVSVDSRTVPADARIIIGLRLKKNNKKHFVCLHKNLPSRAIVKNCSIGRCGY